MEDKRFLNVNDVAVYMDVSVKGQPPVLRGKDLLRNLIVRGGDSVAGL